MSKANNAVYGTSYIPPNQQGDAYAQAQQIVFQGISTLSTFQLTNNDDWIQMYAVSPTLPPLFTTEVNIQSLPSIQAVLGRTQYMLTSSNTSINSDLNMNNHNVLNVNEIDVQDVNLGGHHLTTDANGDLLIDGQPADKEWYKQPVPIGSNITFLSANPLSLVNTLYTPNGTDLWYNNVNLCSGGGGGGGNDWATYPANSNVDIPAPYGISVGSNAPVATFPTITLCGNTTIGRQSIIPLNAPNVEIYPYEFNVGSALYPALSIELASGVGGTTITSVEGVSVDATIDVNINAGGVVALDAGADVNVLAVGEISLESANTTFITGAMEVGTTTLTNTATTSIINTAPLIEMNGITNVVGAFSVQGATTAITSLATSINSATSISLTSPLNTILGLQTTFSGANVSLYPTNNLALGQNSVNTYINGSILSLQSPNGVIINGGSLVGMAIQNNYPLRVGNITDLNGLLNIRASNVANDSVSLCNVSYINSVNGTNLSNLNTAFNTKRIAFTGNINQGDIINISSIVAQDDLYMTIPDDFIINANQVAMTAPTEIDLNSQNLLKLESATQVLINGATTNMNSATTNITATSQVNINAPIVNIPNASHNTSVINCSTITTSTITTNGNVAITNGGLSVGGTITTPFNIDTNGLLLAGANNIQYPILIVPPTFPGNIVPVYVGGAYPCYRYSIPCSGLPAGRMVYFSISAQVQVANAGFPAFYGAGYGTIMLNSTPASKWFYRAVWGSGSAFPFILDDSQEIVGDIVNTFLPSITANSVPTGSTYGEGITLQFNYTYTTPVRNANLYITWDLYGFNLVAPYTLNQLQLTTDIQMSIVG